MDCSEAVIEREAPVLANERSVEESNLIAREERRQLTKEYRGLIKKFEDLKQAPEENGLINLTDGVTEASKLFSRVKGTYEASLDSKVLLLTSELGFQHARNLKIDGQVFDRGAYLKCLQNYVGINPTNPHIRSSQSMNVEDEEDDLKWTKLGNLAARCMNRAPTMDFMLGPLNIQKQKRRKVARTREISHSKDTIKPQKLAQTDIKQQENDTVSNVLHVYNILKQVGPLNLFEFIINPFHFGQSVENLFYLSFLIRDGRAEIRLTGKHPTVQVAEPPSQNDYLDGLQKKQLVMELDSHSWAQLIDIFNIKRPIIPDRTPASTLSNGSFK